MTTDLSFQYRGVLVADQWPAGARFQGSQTRYQSRQRIDGTERYRAELPSGEVLVARSQSDIKAQIREALEASTPADVREERERINGLIHRAADGTWVVASYRDGRFYASLSPSAQRTTGCSQTFSSDLNRVAGEHNTYRHRASAVRALVRSNGAI